MPKYTHFQAVWRSDTHLPTTHIQCEPAVYDGVPAWRAGKGTMVYSMSGAMDLSVPRETGWPSSMPALPSAKRFWPVINALSSVSVESLQNHLNRSRISGCFGQTSFLVLGSTQAVPFFSRCKNCWKRIV